MLRLFCVLSLCLSLIAPAHAGGSHYDSAFQFAARKDWHNALGHARATGDAALVKLITWQYIMDSDSPTPFAEIARFLDENRHWPDQRRIRLRAELALRDADIPDRDLIAWFGGETPITGIGKIALADALRREKLASKEAINELVKEGWKNGDFDEAQEKAILERYGKTLTQADHIARTDRLLWEEKTGAAKRMFPLLPRERQKLSQARISLITDSKLASAHVALVPSSLKSDAGLIYDRMRWRARRKDHKGVRQMLHAAPANPPYPDKWWRYREMVVRDYIEDKKYNDALKLLARPGDLDAANLADAIWLKGWIKCEFQDNCKSAYADFAELYDKVRYPVSRARAAYWAGRAASRSGDQQTATGWYNTAGHYSTTYYGQLALLKNKGKAPLTFASPPQVGESGRAEFERSDAVKAIRLALKYDGHAIASRLVGSLIENGNDESQMALLANLGHDAGHPFVSVRAAKKALQQNVVLVRSGYPMPATPRPEIIERPLTLAITRQESEFDPEARSPSNARGMMQLLPSTAKETAKKNHLPYALSKLSDPMYNMTLGSQYLKRLIDSYDGSYVLAIAAYNAGPGNVRKWMQSFGTPGNDIDRAVNWIEKIPFAETRNYVQRVLENLQVFRAVESGASHHLLLGDDLRR